MKLYWAFSTLWVRVRCSQSLYGWKKWRRVSWQQLHCLFCCYYHDVCLAFLHLQRLLSCGKKEWVPLMTVLSVGHTHTHTREREREHNDTSESRVSLCEVALLPWGWFSLSILRSQTDVAKKVPPKKQKVGWKIHHQNDSKMKSIIVTCFALLAATTCAERTQTLLRKRATQKAYQELKAHLTKQYMLEGMLATKTDRQMGEMARELLRENKGFIKKWGKSIVSTAKSTFDLARSVVPPSTVNNLINTAQQKAADVASEKASNMIGTLAGKFGVSAENAEKAANIVSGAVDKEISQFNLNSVFNGMYPNAAVSELTDEASRDFLDGGR